MVTSYQKQAPPPGPDVMSTTWLEKAMKSWGPEWGDIVSIGTPAKMDYYDSHRNKHYHVMGEHPA
eukprot:4469494-Karenia_brevis.AAC.1